jgi:hypothetical protein
MESGMKKRWLMAASCAATLWITGCSDSEGSKGDNAASEADVKVASGGWDATNACILLDKTAVGAVLNDNVTETTVGLVNQASAANAATSECTYMLQSGGRASLMTRNSLISDNTPEAIALARKATQESVAAFTDKKVEDMPGLGKAAFFVPGINQLNVFIDEKRFVILTISSAPNATAQATAVELFKKIKS